MSHAPEVDIADPFPKGVSRPGGRDGIEASADRKSLRDSGNGIFVEAFHRFAARCKLF